MIGERIGAYAIVQQIGEGGMGTVWLAEHAMLGRRAAIKMLHANVSGQVDITTRFFNEARAAAAIQDPGIVQIFDFGQHTDGRAYIVMELLDGEALDRRLSRLERLPVHDALRIIRQVASSLGAAHKRGIVHRDLKPDNIFLVRDAEVAGGERAKILDFGIAKMANGSGLKTETSVVMGTPLFMSPEQCRGAGKVDQRSDVYSLGCLLFTLLTGSPPFCGDGPGDIIAMHLREAAPVPSTLIAGIPHVVDSLILRCLEKDPARRYSSGEEVAAALEGVSTSAAVRAISKHDSSSAEPGPKTPPHSTTLSAYSQMASEAQIGTRPPRYRGNWLFAGVTAALLTALTVAVVIVRSAKVDGSEEIASAKGSSGEPPSTQPPISTERSDTSDLANKISSPPRSLPEQPQAPQQQVQQQEPAAQQQQPAQQQPEQKQSAQQQQPAQQQPEQKQSAQQQPPAQQQPAAQQRPGQQQQPAQRKLLRTRGGTASKEPAPQKIAKVTPAPGKQSSSTENKPVTLPNESSSFVPDPAPPAPAATTPETADAEQAKAVCAVQAAKHDAFIKNSYLMKPDGVVREAKRLATSCLDRNQRRSLGAAAIRAACSLGDKATVQHFYDLAESASLRPLCSSFLGTEESVPD